MVLLVEVVPLLNGDISCARFSWQVMIHVWTYYWRWEHEVCLFVFVFEFFCIHRVFSLPGQQPSKVIQIKESIYIRKEYANMTAVCVIVLGHHCHISFENTLYRLLYHAIENTGNQNTAKRLFVRQCYIQSSHHAPRVRRIDCVGPWCAYQEKSIQVTRGMLYTIPLKSIA